MVSFSIPIVYTTVNVLNNGAVFSGRYLERKEMLCINFSSFIFIVNNGVINGMSSATNNGKHFGREITEFA